MSGMAQEFGALVGDLSEAVMDCSVPVTVIRSRQSALVNGRVQPPIEETFVSHLSVQPMSNRELQMLPEGMRTQNRVKAYGVDELRTAETSECKIPDRFVHRGSTYQIEKIGDWYDAGNFFRYEAVRLER